MGVTFRLGEGNQRQDFGGGNRLRLGQDVSPQIRSGSVTWWPGRAGLWLEPRSNSVCFWGCHRGRTVQLPNTRLDPHLKVLKHNEEKIIYKGPAGNEEAFFFFLLAGRGHTQPRPKYSLSVCLGTIYSFCLLTPVHTKSI